MCAKVTLLEGSKINQQLAAAVCVALNIFMLLVGLYSSLYE